jgi:O-antigen/teichoic acid export membrane protein
MAHDRDTTPADGALAAVTRQVSTIAVGMAVLGLSSFAYLSVIGRTLGPADFAPLATLWVLVNSIGPALFYPLEQETGRVMAHRRVLGQGSRPVFAKVCLMAAALLTVAGVVLLLFADEFGRSLFNGETVVVLGLFIGLIGLAAEHVTRGVLVGGASFGRYGSQLAADGLLRVGGAAVLAVAGVTIVGWYGLLLGLAPLLAVLITLGRLGPAFTPGPPVSWAELTTAIGWLTLGAFGSQFVVNAPAVAASALAGPGEAARAGVFIGVLVIARVPLMLFIAVQAPLLSGLAALAARNEVALFRQRLLAVMGAVSGVAALGAAAMVVLGPWLVTVVYGPGYETTRAAILPLAVASALYMVASALGQTLVSVRGYRGAFFGWLAGVVAFLAVVQVPASLETRVGTAFLAACAVATVGLLLGLRIRMRRPLSVAADDLEAPGPVLP